MKVNGHIHVHNVNCEANVSSKETLYNHIKTVHEGKKFECKICDTFTSKNMSN